MQRNNLCVVHFCVEVYTMLNCHLTQTWIAAARAIVLARAAVTDEVADHTLVKDTYNTAYEVDRKRALGIILSQSRQQDHEDAKVLEEAKRITEARLDTKVC
jgi:DNA methyltransferase 1-associated protein 1